MAKRFGLISLSGDLTASIQRKRDDEDSTTETQSEHKTQESSRSVQSGEEVERKNRAGVKYNPRKRAELDFPDSGLKKDDFKVGDQVSAYYEGEINNCFYRGVVKSVTSEGMIVVHLHELVEDFLFRPSLLTQGYVQFAQ